jgi:protein-tyrosine phosphatase
MTNSINFRDCGGYPTNSGRLVKTGMLYRSASLDRVFGKNRRIVLAAGLKTMIDFRPGNERAKRIAAFPGVQRISIPLIVDKIATERILPYFNKRNGTPQLIVAVESTYRDIVPLVTEAIHQIFTILADGNAYPLCLNCRAGKDRTGYAVAIILRTLGVPERLIYEDYLATNNYLLPRVRLITRPLSLLSFGLLPTRTWEASITAYERYLQTAFRVIDKNYGGIDGYLDVCGVTGEMRDQVKKLLCT